MIPPVAEFWALVAELEAARARGFVTLLAAVAQVYPADQAVAAVLAEEAALWAPSSARPPEEPARTEPARSRPGPAACRLPDLEPKLASWCQAQRIISDEAAQGLSGLMAQTPLAAIRPGYGRPIDGAVL